MTDPTADELDDDYDEPEPDDFDCHMDSRGFCGKAGSEECDFECPYRALYERGLKP